MLHLVYLLKTSFYYNNSAATALSVPYKQKYIKQKGAAGSLQYQLLPELTVVVAPWDRGMNLHPVLYKCPEPPSSEYRHVGSTELLSFLSCLSGWWEKTSTPSIHIMTLLYLLPRAYAMVAAVYSCSGATDRCSKQLCGRCRQNSAQMAIGKLQHFCRWLSFVCIIFMLPSSVLWVSPS